MIYSAGYWLVWAFLKAFSRFRTGGLEHVPADGPLILCCNHASYLDPPCVGVAVANRQIWFMARDSLFRFRPFGALIRSVHAFPIRRGAVDRGAWQQFEDLCAAGRAVIFFPEGTRSPDGALQRAKAGSGLLIHRCRTAKVVPVRVFGTDKAWPKGKAWPRPAPISVAFGPALDFSAERALPGDKELYQAMADRVMEAIGAIKPPS